MLSVLVLVTTCVVTLCRCGVTLDIIHPNPSICSSFEYTFAVNAMRLIVPMDGQSIAKLMNGMEEVWTAQTGETLGYTNLYLNKDKEPELMHVVAKTESGISRRYYARIGGKWESCNNHKEKLKSLATCTKWISDFVIHLENVQGDYHCTIFQVDLLGVTTKHFYPNPGHLATEVKDGENSLWTTPCQPTDTQSSTDQCLSCIIYKRGGEELLEMDVLEASSRSKRYYEKNGQEWKEIEKREEYMKKLKGIMGGPATKEDGQRSHQSCNFK